MAFYCQPDEHTTGEQVRKFSLTLSNEFDERLIVELDSAPCFGSSIVTDLEDQRDLEFVR